MTDRFEHHADQVSAPATRAAGVTPDDVAALTEIPKALFVGSGGDIAMRGAGGGADTIWRNVRSGTLIPFRAQYVRETGTTASDLLALY